MFPEKSASSRRVLKCQHSSERLFPDAQHSADRSRDEGQEQEVGDTLWDCPGVSVRVEEERERGESQHVVLRGALGNLPAPTCLQDLLPAKPFG